MSECLFRASLWLWKCCYVLVCAQTGIDERKCKVPYRKCARVLRSCVVDGLEPFFLVLYSMYHHIYITFKIFSSVKVVFGSRLCRRKRKWMARVHEHVESYLCILSVYLFSLGEDDIQTQPNEFQLQYLCSRPFL